LESQLRPREIQARIRAGASVEQVAAAAGVPMQKIERFAYPVLLERSRTAEVAQRAHPVRADGPDVRMLGDVVAHTFGLRGQEYTEAEWDSVEGRGRPLGRRPVLARRAVGQPRALDVPARSPRWHGHRARRAGQRPGRGACPCARCGPVGPVIDIARADEAPPVPPAPAELRAAASDTLRPTRAHRRPRRVERAFDRTAADRVTADRLTADRLVAVGSVAAERMAAERAAAERGRRRRRPLL
jgi:hypothetical protein